MEQHVHVTTDLNFASHRDAYAAISAGAEALGRGEKAEVRVTGNVNSELCELFRRSGCGINATLTEAVRVALTYPARDLCPETRFQFVAAVLAEFRPGILLKHRDTVGFDARHSDAANFCRMYVPRTSAERLLTTTFGLSLRELALTLVPAGLLLSDFDPETVLMRFWPKAVYCWVRTGQKTASSHQGRDEQRYFRHSLWRVDLA